MVRIDMERGQSATKCISYKSDDGTPNFHYITDIKNIHVNFKDT